VKSLNGEARRDVAASLAESYALLRDVERYTQWHGEAVREVQVLARDPEGLAERVHARLRVRLGPLDREFELMLAVQAQPPTEVLLHRLAHEPSDPEALSLRWMLAPVSGAGAGTRIELQMSAVLDVPRLLPLPGGVAAEMAAQFVAAAALQLGG
jgi:ribosome-associated toxin RatA of RatAB toxin-antitoxin module